MAGLWDSNGADKDDKSAVKTDPAYENPIGETKIPLGSGDPDAEMYASFPPVMDPFFFKHKERFDAILGALAAGAYKGIRSL